MSDIRQQAVQLARAAATRGTDGDPADEGLAALALALIYVGDAIRETAQSDKDREQETGAHDSRRRVFPADRRADRR